MTAGREEAFTAALTAQMPALRRYATALLGHATAADDLVQDCIERALRQADSLLDPLRMGAWLRSILSDDNSSRIDPGLAAGRERWEVECNGAFSTISI